MTCDQDDVWLEKKIELTYDKILAIEDKADIPVSYTHLLDLSRLLVDMIETDKYGYYHATNEGGYRVCQHH